MRKLDERRWISLRNLREKRLPEPKWPTEDNEFLVIEHLQTGNLESKSCLVINIRELYGQKREWVYAKKNINIPPSLYKLITPEGSLLIGNLISFIFYRNKAALNTRSYHVQLQDVFVSHADVDRIWPIEKRSRYTTGKVGSPSETIGLILPQYKLLCQQGRKFESTSACARELLDWFTKTHPNLKPPSFNTVRNNTSKSLDASGRPSQFPAHNPSKEFWAGFFGHLSSLMFKSIRWHTRACAQSPAAK